jgi:hypothetical protein
MNTTTAAAIIPTVHGHYCPTCEGLAPCGGPFSVGNCLLVESCISCGRIPNSERFNVDQECEGAKQYFAS